MGTANRIVEKKGTVAIGQALSLGALMLAVMTGCTHKVQIEPSDKPFIVNLNVKVDHEIKVRMEEENQDLLSLEDEVIAPRKSASKKAGGKKK